MTPPSKLTHEPEVASPSPQAGDLERGHHADRPSPLRGLDNQAVQRLAAGTACTCSEGAGGHIPSQPCGRRRLLLRRMRTGGQVMAGAATPALEISQPGEPAEREAEAVARSVQTGQPVRPITAVSQDRAPPSALGEQERDPDSLSARIEAQRAAGQPLTEPIRIAMEERLGHDLSHVRVHVDGEAAQLNRELDATAFTSGAHIFFSEGSYDPSTEAGSHLLAHELTHTIQQHERNPPATTPAPRRIARQQASATPATTTGPGQPGPAAPTGPAQSIPGSMELESDLQIERSHRGDVEVLLAPRLVHERKIHIRTQSGAEATLTVRGETLFPQGLPAEVAPETALDLPGQAGMGYTLEGTLADGTPVMGFGTSTGDDTSLRGLADSGPAFARFDLSPEQQYQAVADALRQTVSERTWEQAERAAEERRRGGYPPQGTFQRLTPAEKSDLFWEQLVREVVETFSWENLLIAVGAAVMLAVLGAVAVAATGALAIVAFVAFVVATLVALGFLVANAISDLLDRLSRDEYVLAILGLLKDLALVVAVVAGALAVVALFFGVALFGFTAGALAAIALAAVGVAILLMVAMVLVNWWEAVGSEDIERFKRHVREGAKQVNEGIVTFIVTIITLALGPILGRILPPRARPGGGRGPGERPPAPQEERPPAPQEERPAGYDPAGRTDEQLRLDLDPLPRPGETLQQAEARARAAAGELQHRQVMRIYEGLGDEPPEINLRQNDRDHGAAGAHTMERHGPDIPLRRTDAPPNARTIQGRIYGDQPWGRPSNWSYKWINEATMNRTVNDYLRANWEAIRSDLALQPGATHEATFDAGRAVGEGFFNEIQIGVRPRHVPQNVDRSAVYHRTSYVQITIRLLPGDPPSFVIIRAFPAGRGPIPGE